ncbi:MAG: phosphoribosylformylglycinamidine synthase I [Pseudomonadota bacterium]
MNIKIAVIQFPGSNTERETFMALERVGLCGEEFLWNRNASDLRHYDGYIIVGGFAYEDRSRAGIIAALDPIIDVLRIESEKGKPVLGICNGAQILIESGLVPGVKDCKTVAVLTENRRVQNGQVLGTGYYNVWTNSRRGKNSNDNAFNGCLADNELVKAPIAHAEGRFMMSSDLLQKLEQQGQIAYQYCDDQGNLHDEFPINPNGSMASISALCNVNGNIMAMMPHPERSPLGDVIFKSMRHYIESNHYSPVRYFDWQHETPQPSHYKTANNTLTFTITLMITDNHAASVQTALQAKHIDARIKRQIYWEIIAEPGTSLEKLSDAIISSGELWNINKETEQSVNKTEHTQSLLIVAHDDIIGQQKQQLLAKHYGIKGIHQIKHGIIWHLHSEKTIEASTEAILKTHILFNPVSHNGYYY